MAGKCVALFMAFVYKDNLKTQHIYVSGCVSTDGPDQPHLGSPPTPLACFQLCLFSTGVPEGWGCFQGLLCSLPGQAVPWQPWGFPGSLTCEDKWLWVPGTPLVHGEGCGQLCGGPCSESGRCLALGPSSGLSLSHALPKSGCFGVALLILRVRFCIFLAVLRSS